MQFHDKCRDKVRIVVIDSGIDTNQYKLKDNVIESTGFRINAHGTIERLDSVNIENNHGTVIANCIKFLCNEVELIDINILDENLRSNSRILIKALKLAKDFKPHIINLSLGTTLKRYYIPLRLIINSLVKDNVLIVASVDNRGINTYPAAYRNTVGVKARNDADISKFFYNNNYYYASGWENEFICGNKDRNKIFGNSIATAYITGHLCKIIEKNNFNIDKGILNKIIRGDYYGN